MPLINIKTLLKSFRYAIKGIKYVFQNEQNFRVQLFIALLVILGMVLFKVTIGEAIALFLLIILILVLEVINTVFEKFADILEPRMSIYVKVIKDMMAGAVLISAIGAVMIGLLIFFPYLVAFF